MEKTAGHSRVPDARRGISPVRTAEAPVLSGVGEERQDESQGIGKKDVQQLQGDPKKRDRQSHLQEQAA